MSSGIFIKYLSKWFGLIDKMYYLVKNKNLYMSEH